MKLKELEPSELTKDFDKKKYYQRQFLIKHPCGTYSTAFLFKEKNTLFFVASACPDKRLYIWEDLEIYRLP